MQDGSVEHFKTKMLFNQHFIERGDVDSRVKLKTCKIVFYKLQIILNGRSDLCFMCVL